MNQLKVDIIIRAKDGHDLTETCIRSIRENTPEEMYRIILVDDGSSPPLWESIEDPGDMYVAAPVPQGAVTATNRGLALSLQNEDTQFVAVFDNDVRVPDGDTDWLLRFISELLEYDDTGVVGAVSGNVNRPQHVLHWPLTYQAEWKDEDTRRMGLKKNPPVSTFVSFACLFRKEVIRRVGFWDTQYNPGNYEDTDYGVQLRAAGLQCRVARSVYMHHDCHATFGNDLQILLAENRKKFFAKWGAGRLMDMGLVSQEELIKAMLKNQGAA